MNIYSFLFRQLTVCVIWHLSLGTREFKKYSWSHQSFRIRDASSRISTQTSTRALVFQKPQVSSVLRRIRRKRKLPMQKKPLIRIARDLRIAVLSFRFTVTHRWEHKQGVSWIATRILFRLVRDPRGRCLSIILNYRFRQDARLCVIFPVEK